MPPPGPTLPSPPTYFSPFPLPSRSFLSSFLSHLSVISFLFLNISPSSLSSYYPLYLSSLPLPIPLYELHSSSFPIILYTSPPCHPVPLLLPISPIFFIFSFLTTSSASLFPSPSLSVSLHFPSLSSFIFLSLLLPPHSPPLCPSSYSLTMHLSSLHSHSLPVSSFVSSIILLNNASLFSPLPLPPCLLPCVLHHTPQHCLFPLSFSLFLFLLLLPFLILAI